MTYVLMIWRLVLGVLELAVYRSHTPLAISHPGYMHIVAVMTFKSPCDEVSGLREFHHPKMKCCSVSLLRTVGAPVDAS